LTFFQIFKWIPPVKFPRVMFPRVQWAASTILSVQAKLQLPPVKLPWVQWAAAERTSCGAAFLSGG
jgi:hypothetical protein